MIENIGAYSQVDYERGHREGYELGLKDGETIACAEGNLRSAYEQGKEEGIAKGRADAIEELEKIISKIFSIQNNDKSKFRPSIVITKGMMEDILEQLKEQKNE